MSTGAGAGIDYSGWDHIYVSDDEDVTCPYVDTPSLFKMRHRVSSETCGSREVWSLKSGNSWVWSEGQNITLECSVQNVAPVENLTVTFYRGQRQLGQKQSNKTGDKPVSETFHLDFTSTKEDDGGEFWCEAELLLGPDGPQPPPVVKSRNFSATVFYEPYLTGASHPSPTVLTEGNPLQLDCFAVGNPRPTYTWAVPSGVSPTKSSVLIINSTTTEDKGQYTCFVSNNQGTVTVKFDVEVKRDYTKHHIAAAIIGAAVVIFLVVIIYFKCYKK